MHSNRPQQTIISSQMERIVQNAAMLSGLKLKNICLKMVRNVSISGERKTVQLPTIKMPVKKTQNGLVNHVFGIFRSRPCRLLCSTSASPCNNPHNANVMLLPCQIPTSSRVMRQWKDVRTFPCLLPPKGIYT